MRYLRTKMFKMRKSKSPLLFIVCLVVLFLSFSVNLFKLVGEDNFHNFDLFSESLVYGKIARSQQDGVFVYGGFTGNNYQLPVDSLNTVFDFAYPRQLGYLLGEEPTPAGYQTYTSQSGGQAIMYSFFYKLSPLSERTNFRLIKLINAFLVALMFSLFLAWVYRSFGLITASTTLLLITVSPWLVFFGHSLWWSLWSFYLPFVVMLLALENKHSNSDCYPDKKILGMLFCAVFVKCFFTGFEFITSTLLASICPVVYYFILDKKSFWSFIRFSFKAGVVCVLAVFSEMLILIVQFKYYMGSFAAGLQHILYSYSKRTTLDPDDPDLSKVSLAKVLNTYLDGNILDATTWLPHKTTVPFVALQVLMLIAGVLVFWVSKKKNKLAFDNELIYKTRALLGASAFSVLAPFSWFVIFKQHATGHPHLDYIVWYMPFLLFGFMVIGYLAALLCYPKCKLNKRF